MKKLSYLEKFTLAARWILPQGEAARVIEDYRGRLSTGREDGDAKKQFGSPIGAIMAFADKKRYWRWVFTFCLLFVFLFTAIFDNVMMTEFDRCFMEFIPAVMIFGFVLWAGLELLTFDHTQKLIWVLLVCCLCFILFCCFLFISIGELPFFYGEHMLYLTALLGVLWFGFGKEEEKRFSMPLLAGLILTFLAVASIYGLSMYSFYVNIYPFSYHLGHVYVLSTIAMAALGAVAVLSLVLARMYDRRWRAVFVIALTGLLMCFALRNFAFSRIGNLGITENLIYGFYNDAQASRSNPYPRGLCSELSRFFNFYFGAGLLLALIGLAPFGKKRREAVEKENRLNESYLKRLTLAARWFLPSKEADEMVEDYREMLAEARGDESSFAPPMQAVLEAAEKKQVVLWHLMLGLMLLCPFAAMGFFLRQEVWLEGQIPLSLLGAAVSLFFFGIGGKRKLPRPLLISVVGAGLANGGLVGGILYFVVRMDWRKIMVEAWPMGPAAVLVIRTVFVIAFLASLLGLAVARLSDRRWRALYILGLSLLVICSYSLRYLWSMEAWSIDIDGDLTFEYWPPVNGTFGLYNIFFCLVGFFAAGVGLC